jgi:O-antigen biosynthesis protein
MTQTLPLDGKQFEGALLGRSGNFLIGWVSNLAHPDKVVTVDLIGDGQWIGTARAGLNIEPEDPQLIMPTEAHGHAFAFNIQPLDWQSIARFEALVTNNEYRLSGVVFTHLDTQALSKVYSTRVENHGGLRLWGWAWDTLDPNYNQTIYAYEEGRLIAECSANQYCADLEDAACGTVNHGFSLTLPMELADGGVHEIQVVTAHGQILNGSPITVLAPQATLKTWANALHMPQQDRRFLSALMERYAWHIPLSTDFSSYPLWFDRFGSPKSQSYATTSVLIAITGDDDVENTLGSLVNQSHSQWTALVGAATSSFADPRIHYVEPAKWSKQLQHAISQANGIVSFITAGDSLPPEALAALVEAFDDPSVQCAYTDCDQVQPDGKTTIPWFKPDWDPDLFLAHTPLHHLFATRPSNLAINSPYIAEPNAWPWLVVQAVGDNPETICHIPRVLYHLRKGAIPPVHINAQRGCDAAIAPDLKRAVTNNRLNTLTWASPPEWPIVSLIIPTRDHVELLQCCIESLLKTDYPNLEIIVMDNDSAKPDALAYLDQIKNKNIKVIKHPGAFNFSTINNRAVQQAKGSLIGLINNDIEAIDSQWLKAMVRHLLRPNVGAVGGKLLWPNGMVQHAGVVLGLHGLVGHTGNDWHKDDIGYFGYNQITHSTSAVTAACLICKREDYLAVGGLDEKDFPVNFNDVDFCLKLRSLGKRIVWTPEAQLLHAESASRGGDNSPDRRGRLAREKNRLMQKWHQWIMDDPYYNPNLNLDAYSYAGLAIPPRERALLNTNLSQGKRKKMQQS